MLEAAGAAATDLDADAEADAEEAVVVDIFGMESPAIVVELALVTLEELEETEVVAFVDAAPPAMLMGVTVPVLLAAFWYQGIPKASGTVMMFQPLGIILGYSAMKTPTVLGFSSCSRIQSPGVLGPVSHPSMADSTDWRVYAGSLPMAQSPESVCVNSNHRMV